MSYATAKKCFQENLDMVGDPMSDPQTFNLNVGLLNLTDEIESDISHIKTALRQIAAALNRR